MTNRALRNPSSYSPRHIEPFGSLFYACHAAICTSALAGNTPYRGEWKCGLDA